MKRLLTPILLLLLTAAPALACPMCKDSVPSSDAQAAGGLPSGFNNSIYLMLGAFFCVLGFVTFTIVKSVRVPSATKNAFPIITTNQD
ncbi:MAG: hypothetical protein QOE14_2184 [Humisphaera sp.]|nr:hypothetical protein [Humisphaera sp.]